MGTDVDSAGASPSLRQAATAPLRRPRCRSSSAARFVLARLAGSAALAFAVAAIVPATAAAFETGEPLRLSFEADHDPSQDLEGSNFTGSACVFLSTEPAKIGPVAFYLDGVLQATENYAPWDYFGGTSSDCNLGTFAAGTHTIRATWVGGEHSATFTVGTGNAPPPPLAPASDCHGLMSPPSFTLAHCDAFDGWALDPSVWDRYGGDASGGTCWEGHAGNGLRCERAVSVADGIATITATPASQSISGKLEAGAFTYSRSDLMQAYGRYETRVRSDLDPSNTMSAVVLNWVNGGSLSDWCDNEADFYETLTGPNVSSFFHYQLNSDNGDCSPISSISNHRQVYCSHGVTRDVWHDIVYEWTPSRMTVWNDGRQVCNITDPLVLRDEPAHTVWQFDAFGVNLTTPVRMQVAYARLYHYTP